MHAFMFPGQGSQLHGVGRPWVDHPSWELVDEASQVAERDVARLLLDADPDELRDTRNAQLTTFVISLMVLDAVERLGVEPAMCAGHSLGEYTALTASGSVAFDEGVRLVAERAEAMHQAGADRPGTMSAVLGLSDEDVDIACRRADDDVWVANFNAPGQVVVAGSPEGVAAASAVAKELGAKKSMPLHVAGAFHTPFMTPARDRLRKAIAQARPRDTDVPVVANVDARPHHRGEEWASLLSAQLSSPVRWRQSLLAMADRGVDAFIELGGGHVLTGMVKRTVPDARTFLVATPEDLDPLLEFVSGGHPQRHAAAGAGDGAGEHLAVTERLVVSPSGGVFTPATVAVGAPVEVGTVLGRVGDHDVRSAFAGVLQAYIAGEGERVAAREPIAWLRTV